jgi:hypothetical protein
VNWALEIPNNLVTARNGFSREIYQEMVNSGEVITLPPTPPRMAPNTPGPVA